jgi:nucleoside-diphosphate-sugar epimerase
MAERDILQRPILVTGALGQIGTELVSALRKRYGDGSVVASDVRCPATPDTGGGRFVYLDCTVPRQLAKVVRRHNVGTIYHLAALLSAKAEASPRAAWALNMGGLHAVLEIARQHDCQVFFPSTIGAFGPTTPRVLTPQITVQRPTTIYGVSKVAGELLCDYYASRYGVDTRGLRLPGLISAVAPPGGGTTDYAVEMFYAAVSGRRYTCFLAPDTRLELMYMPDAIEAMMRLMATDPQRLRHRNAYNVAAISVTPSELAAEIREHVPGFAVDYAVDPGRQAIANSWPTSLDDSCAREDWGWAPQFTLAQMTADMIARLTPGLAWQPSDAIVAHGHDQPIVTARSNLH